MADSAEWYAELAVRLGTDRDYRADVSGRIREAGAVLFEDAGTVAEHEAFFEHAVAMARARRA